MAASETEAGTCVELCLHDTSAGAWRQLLDPPPGRPFLCDAEMVVVAVPLECEDLKELFEFVNERAKWAELLVLQDDLEAPRLVLHACDLRLAQAVRGLSVRNSGVSLLLRVGLELPRTVEACGEKGIECNEHSGN